MTVALSRPKRQEGPILQPIVEEIRSVQRTTLLDPARPSILTTFRSWHRQALQARASRSWTGSTSSSRTRSTRYWRNRRPMKGKSSRWSSGTSNRRSNCSKNTNRSNSSCSRNSNQRTGSRPRGKLVLRRESPNRSLNGPSLNDHCGTRSRRSKGKVLAWIRLGCNALGTPSFHRVPFFSPGTPHSMVCDTVDRKPLEARMKIPVQMLTDAAGSFQT